MANPTDEQILALAVSQHGGALAPYVNDPEIRPILLARAKNEIDDATMLGRLQQTSWWKSRNESTRTFDALAQADPATAEGRVQQQTAALESFAQQIGVKVTPERLRNLAIESLRGGWSPAQMQQALEGEYTYSRAQLAGQAGQFRSQVEELARKYFVKTTEDDYNVLVTQLVRGDIDTAQIEQVFRDYAKTLAPAWTSQLDAGMTMESLAAPTRQEIASTLGVNPAMIDFTEAKWQRFIASVNEKGERVALDPWQVRQTLRTDPTYGWRHTPMAMEESSNLVLGIAQSLGRIA